MNEQSETLNTQASPLQNWRVVITRSEEQADSLAERLRNLGAEPISYPTISIAHPEDITPLDDALREVLNGTYDWIVLTSVNTVKVVKQRLELLRPEQPTLESVDCQVASVGPTTTNACKELLGAHPAIVPKKFYAEGLAEAMGNVAGQKILLANADIARPVLHELLQQAGADINRVIAYRTVPATGGENMPQLLRDGAIDAITFTSGSTARYFVERIGNEALAYAQKSVVACIGPIAADGAKAVGLPPNVVASTYTEEGLVDALVAYATTHQTRASG